MLPNFETEDEDSEEGQSEKENDPVRTAGGGQTSQTSAGKGKARAIDGVHAPSSLPAASQPVKRRTSEIAELAPNDPACERKFNIAAVHFRV